MVLVAGARLGPYEIQSPLGAGGMGEVYRAIDTRLDRTVAVKILARDLGANPARQERFEREARALRGESPAHLHAVRPRRTRRRSIPGHGVRRGSDARRAPARRTAADPAAASVRDRHRRRARARASARHRAPRSEAGEHHADKGRRQSPRLRRSLEPRHQSGTNGIKPSRCASSCSSRGIIRTSTTMPFTSIIQTSGLSASLLGRHHRGSSCTMRKRRMISRAFAEPALWLTPNRAHRSVPRTWGVWAWSNKKFTAPSAYVMPQAHVSTRPLISGDGRLRASVVVSSRARTAYSSVKCARQTPSVRLTIASNLCRTASGTRSRDGGGMLANHRDSPGRRQALRPPVGRVSFEVPSQPKLSFDSRRPAVAEGKVQSVTSVAASGLPLVERPRVLKP